MKSLFLFGWTVLLFIICCPGVILQPYKHKTFGLLLHGLIFTILYGIMYNHMSSIIEGLETKNKPEKEDNSNIEDKFEDAKKKLFKELKNIDVNKLPVQEQVEKTKEIFDKMFSDWSEEDIQTFQTKYEKYFTENFEIGDHENLEYVLNNASPEKIKYIDSLPQRHQEALEKIYNSMEQDKIDKILELDNDKFKQVLSDIINKE